MATAPPFTWRHHGAAACCGFGQWHPDPFPRISTQAWQHPGTQPHLLPPPSVEAPGAKPSSPAGGCGLSGLTGASQAGSCPRAHTAAACTRPPAAAAVSGAQPASSLVPTAGFSLDPSECRRGEGLKALKPPMLSGNEGTTQTQSGPLPVLAPRLVLLHAKAEPGSPFIKALIGTGVHQIIFQPLASAGCLHAVPCMLLHRACLEPGIGENGPKTVSSKSKSR